MALKDEFAEEECFQLEDGTPALTIQQEHQQLMIPWIHFRHATFEEGTISLYFQSWLVLISGVALTELWEAFQTQAVRSIEVSEVGGAIQELEVMAI